MDRGRAASAGRLEPPRARVFAAPGPAALASVFALGNGERDALAVARLRGGMLLTDDAAARLAAESLGLRVHGTLGVLVRAARARHRTPAQVLACLQALPTRSTLHLRASLLAQVVEQFRAVHGL